MEVTIEVWVGGAWSETASYVYNLDTLSNLGRLIEAAIANKFSIRITIN